VEGFLPGHHHPKRGKNIMCKTTIQQIKIQARKASGRRAQVEEANRLLREAGIPARASLNVAAHNGGSGSWSIQSIRA
jgi:hypothetical protein